ncbi:sensor histidine kinase [Chryseobacterium indologenes]|uniref:sensor histidine kinase n=2 Tax=Chryseobacterium indologenes TaxID=253 RepID=UPI0009A1BC95|nr:HAMP domain-containing sensor histidine kinase [Chryseobacterium indologenes]
MSLSLQFARAFACLVFFVLMMGFIIMYFALERTIVRSAILKLQTQNMQVAQQLEQNPSYDYTLFGQNPAVTMLPDSQHISKRKQIAEKYIWNSNSQSYINKIEVMDYLVIHKKKYSIKSIRYITIIEHRFLTSILMVIAWITIFLIILTIIVSTIVSKSILEPFYCSLDEIKKFNLKDHSQMNLMETNIKEFKLLNQFLLKMSDNSKKDYNLLEELSENTSHELQTPLASMKGKIELLMDSQLSEYQLTTLDMMNNELDRLSSINQSLILLAKLEHFEKRTTDPINFSEVLRERLQYFEEIFTLQNLTIITDIQDNIFLSLDKNLAAIIINNLISNARKHNMDNGDIRLKLTEHFFEISNTGYPPTLPTEELFQRFKRGNPNQNSIGIGLALVKRILEIYHTKISYHFNNNRHTIIIYFTNQSIEKQ